MTDTPAQEQLLSRYREIVARLGRDPNNASILFERDDFGARHYERKGKGWDAVVTERGRELERLHLPSDEEALYHLARDTTFAMACAHEVAHRASGQDFRRILFAHQLDLMARVSPEWRDRLAREITATLAEHPYRDDPAKAPPTPQAKPALWPQLAVLAALVAFVIAIHYPLWWSWHAAQRLSEQGVIAAATVTDRSTSYPKTGQTYHLEYAYEAEGRRFSRREVVEKYVHDRSEIGDRLSVWYVPGEPEIVSAAPGDEFVRRVAWYGVIDLLLLLAFGGGFWRFLRGRGKPMGKEDKAAG